MRIFNWVTLAMAAGLAACGGGSPSPSPSPAPLSLAPPLPPAPPPSMSLSKTSLEFVAAAPNLARPQSQSVIATVTGTVNGTLYIDGQPDYLLVESVANSYTNFGNSGYTTFYPFSPSRLGAGVHTSTVSVSVCVNYLNCASQYTNNPQTINVKYTIGSAVVRDMVAPRLAVSGVGGSVVLRGSRFSGASSVRFGSADAVSFTVVDDTEIRAQYPTLATGDHPVLIDSGNKTFTAQLAVRPGAAYAPVTLTLPPLAASGYSGFLRQVLFDRERNALLVLASTPTPTYDGQLIRYRYASGAWLPAEISPVAGINTIAIGHDGSRIYAGAQALLELDPETLSVLESTTPNVPFVTINQITQILPLNSGNLLIIGSYYSQYNLLLFSTATRTFAKPADSTFLYLSNNLGAGVSADGSRILLPAGGSSTTSTDGLWEYTSNGKHWSTNFIGQTDSAAILDRRASKLLMCDRINYVTRRCGIYNAAMQLLGMLPATARAYQMNNAGTKAYLYDGNNLSTYDLTSTSGGQFVQLASPLSISNPGLNFDTIPRLALSDDDAMLAIGGLERVVVIAAP